MSDPETSGAATPAAETVNTPSAPANPTTNQPPGTFGNTRGSGLARGKRPTAQPAQAASAASATDYKPTAVSILTAPTEYKNPFAPPAPAEEAKAPAPQPAPSAEAVPAATPATEAQPSTPAPAQAETGEPDAASSEAEPKAELKILPPETPKRVEHSWESRSFRNVAAQQTGDPQRPAEGQMSGPRPRRDERPVFRPDRERRGERPGELRAPGGEPGRGGESRRPAPTPPTPPAEEKKAGGLFGWVKKIFGNPPAETPAPAPETRGEGDSGRPGGGHRRRRHRGGRGRHFRGDQQGPREGQSGGQFSGEPRGQGGDRPPYGRRRRRRHHGGGGGGGGGGYRGDSRPEGGPPAGS